MDLLVLLSLVLLPKVELDLAALKGAVGRDLKFGLSAGDGAKVAPALLDVGRHAGPGRVMVGDTNLVHRRQIAHANVEVLRRNRPGSDVILDVLGQTCEEKLIAASEIASRLRLHGNLFPLGGTLKACMQLDAGRPQTDRKRCHHLVGVAAYEGIAGSHAQIIERGLMAVRAGPK